MPVSIADGVRRSRVQSGIEVPKMLKLSLTVEIRSRLNDYTRKRRIVSEAAVRDEIYNEIRKGTLPGYLRLISSNGRDLGRRFLEARRYENIRRELGDAGLVFFWLKRTSLTGTTVEEWGKLIGINRDVRVETNRCSPECTRWERHPALPRAHNNVCSVGDYVSPTGPTSCLDK